MSKKNRKDICSLFCFVGTDLDDFIQFVFPGRFKWVQCSNPREIANSRFPRCKTCLSPKVMLGSKKIQDHCLIMRCEVVSRSDKKKNLRQELP